MVGGGGNIARGINQYIAIQVRIRKGEHRYNHQTTRLTLKSHFKIAFCGIFIIIVLRISGQNVLHTCAVYN